VSHVSANGQDLVGDLKRASMRFAARPAVETAAALKTGRQARATAGASA